MDKRKPKIESNSGYYDYMVSQLETFKPEEADDPRWYQGLIKEMNKVITSGGYPKLWCYSRPGVMEGHKYSDDVALCFALNKEHAMITFRQMYSKDLLEGKVEEVHFNDYGIFVATSY